MSLYTRWGRASFRGVEFLVDSTEFLGGRKTVVFEFPKKTFRVVEDMGGSLAIFNIVGYIRGSAVQLKRRRDALVAALSQPGLGQLVHPTYGTFKVATDVFTVSDKINELGLYTFQMSFKEARDNIYPTQSANNKSLINRLSAQVLQDAQNAVGDIYEFFDRFRQNYLDMQETLQNISDLFDELADPFTTFQTFLSEFIVQLKNFQANISSNIESPARLSAGIGGLFSSLDNISSDARSRLGLATNFFGYGSSTVYPITPSAQNLVGINNTKAVNSQMNMSALGNAYNAITQIDYTDENDLSAIEGQLDAQYLYFIDNNNFDETYLNNLKLLRNQARLFFENARIAVRKIVPISVQNETITTLTYAYYNNLNDDQTLITLNNITTPNIINGNINILTT